jgi:hypothetical protein
LSAVTGVVVIGMRRVMARPASNSRLDVEINQRYVDTRTINLAIAKQFQGQRMRILSTVC